MATINDINNEITRIDNAKRGIAEAIEEKGVQVPEESRIEEYPGLVRQIQTGSPDAVLYTPQELTPEQQEQARENIGAGTYTKPDTGIPKTDLANDVQTSLGKADTALQQSALTPITELIPEQATPQNKLADKNFVNSSVATNTANYISDNGQPFQSVEDLEAYTGPLTNNDYAFVVGTDSVGNTIYTRYKYNANTQTWAAEYVLNNSSFTAEQWAAISSGITALLVQKLSNLPTEVVTYVSQTLTEAQKQQARTNIGATAPEVFWAEYGVTTYAEIVAAKTAGKACFAIRSGDTKLYPIGDLQSGSARFYVQQGQYNYELRCNSDDTWQTAYSAALRSEDKVDTIIGNETATNKIPTAKAVYDAVNPAIESIQPAGGMLPNVLYNFGQLSNNIAFLLGTISDASIVNHFYWIFETGSSVPTITWPAGLSWFGGSAPQIAANKHYEISVLNGVGVAMEV